MRSIRDGEFVPIKKGEDEAYTNKIELESGPKTLMGFLMQTHLEEIHELWSQSLEMTVVLSTDNSCYLNMDDIMSKSMPWVRRSQQRLRLRLTACSGSSMRINRYWLGSTG